MRSPSLLFLHIPKTGGMTLRAILKREYPLQSIFSIGPEINECIRRFRHIPDTERAEFHVLEGHMSFGLHRYLPEPTCYVTILRNPIDRAVSDYYFVSSTPQHPLYQTVKGMSLQDYMQSGITSQLSNGQTRLLCGDCEPGDEGIPTVRSLTQKDLLTAKQNIQTYFSVVGLQERFDETLILLKRKHGWRYPFYVKINITRARPAIHHISSVEDKLLQKQNELDIQLYQYAQKLFVEQIAEQGFSFKIEVAFFRLLNKVYYGLSFFKHRIAPHIQNIITAIGRTVR